jgi:DNA-binding PadR family transcriptional regulator
MPRNPTSYVILGLLSIHPSLSGYVMRKAVQGSIGYFWGESYGQIYPALKQLTREGLIAKSGGELSGRRPRQEYVLTEAGRRCLREWLAVPFHDEPPKNEFLLKLFFAREAAPGVAAAHLRDFEERNRRMLDALNKIESSVPTAKPSNPHQPYWLLTLGFGKALTTAALAWSESARTELTAAEPSAAPRIRPPKKRAAKKTASSRRHVVGKH